MLLGLGLVQALWAETKPIQDLVIEAEHIEFDAQVPAVEASGNVHFSFDRVSGNTQILRLDWQHDTVQLLNGFGVEDAHNVFSGSNLTLDAVSRNGSIDDFLGSVNKAYIRSKSVQIKPDQLLIDHPEFTTCDQDPPHTKLTASQIVLYPRLAMIVIRDAVLWINNVPVFYLPTYIYGGPALLASAQFIPDIIDEPVQGLTVRQRVGYLINEANAGHVELDWTRNLGFGIGIAHGLRLRNRTEIGSELKVFQGSGWQGHVQIDSKALPIYAEEKNQPLLSLGGLVSSYADDAPQYLINWQLRASSREIVNYQRVSALPALRLTSTLLAPGFTAVAASGYFIEENNMSSGRTRLELVGGKTLLLTEFFSLRPNLDAKHSGYSNGNRNWDRVIAGIDTLWTLTPWDLTLGYSLPLLNNGGSPFLFDTYQVQNSPEYCLHLRHQRNYVSIDLAYTIANQSLREATLNLEQPLHELRLGFGYDFINHSLGIGIRITEL